MGRAKEKILAHKKAREEAKNVKKQAHLRGGSEGKKSDAKGDIERECKCKSSCKVPGTSIAGHSGSVKPAWRNVGSHHHIQARESSSHVSREIADDGDLRLLTISDILSSEELQRLEEILPYYRHKDITPTVAAVALNRYDLIKKLMRDKHVDFDYSERLLTPLSCAVRLQNWEMINYLVEKQLSLHCKNIHESPILVEAALLDTWNLQQLMDLYRLIMDFPLADIKSGDVHGLTLCHAVAKRGWVTFLDEILPTEPLTTESKSLLLDLIDATTAHGVTPIMLAAESGHAEVISYLINRGANFWSEDKFGFTTLCRSLRHMYESSQLTSDFNLDASCVVIIHALNSPQCLVDAKNYIGRRVQVFTNPLWENHLNFSEGFCDLSRASFFFYSACLTGGLEELIATRFISRLVLSGLKYFGQPEYVGTICGIFFDYLVSAHDQLESYNEAVRDFIYEGAADFCCKVMQRSPALPADEASKISENASISSGSNEAEKDPYLDSERRQKDKERSINMAGMLPFIQILDHPQFQNWMSLHFSAVKTAYCSCMIKENPEFVLKCNLHPWQCRHLVSNSMAWELLCSKDDFVPFQDLVSHQIPASRQMLQV